MRTSPAKRANQAACCLASDKRANLTATVSVRLRASASLCPRTWLQGSRKPRRGGTSRRRLPRRSGSARLRICPARREPRSGRKGRRPHGGSARLVPLNLHCATRWSPSRHKGTKLSGHEDTKSRRILLRVFVPSWRRTSWLRGSAWNHKPETGNRIPTNVSARAQMPSACSPPARGGTGGRRACRSYLMSRAAASRLGSARGASRCATRRR